MVNSCSVYGCKSNYKTTGNGNYVTVLSSRIIQQNKQNGSENYQIKTSKLQKHPEYVSDILNDTSSSDTMYFHVQMVILT